MCFSRTLLSRESKEIGQWFLGSEWSPDLGMGDTRAVSHSSGNSPSVMDILNRCVTMGVMLKAVSLSILAEMSSGPFAFVMSRLDSSS